MVVTTTCKPKQHPNSLQMDNSFQILVFQWRHETYKDSAVGLNAPVNLLKYQMVDLSNNAGRGIDDGGPHWLRGLLSRVVIKAW